MNQKIFVNEAINTGINNYLNNTNNEDFITIIIKTLINIYGELDIINPYKTSTESGMGSFDENITKFGYPNENLAKFKENVLNFYNTKEEKTNKYFNEIEKSLIDMFFFKMKSIDKTKVNVEEFENMIQFENKPLNQLYSKDKKEIQKYYNFKKKNNNSNIEYNIFKKEKLNREAYAILGYSYDNVDKMNDQQLLDINNKVFEYFKINKDSDDKYIRLEQAIAYYKEFNVIEEPKPENGYVEFLLLSSFIAISLLVITIVVGVLAR